VRAVRIGVIFVISWALALTGCSGGGSDTARIAGGSTSGGSTSGSTTSASAALTVRVTLPASGLLPLWSKRARADAARVRAGGRHAQAVSLKSVAFEGTLYPGASDSTPINVTLVQNTSSLPASVSLGFNNVLPGDNEWVVVNVVGYDSPNATGSSYVLGQLGGLANVGSPPAFASIDTNSTLRLQVVLAAMYAGIISSWDLLNTPALDPNIGGFITGTSPSATTGLFSNAQVVSFLNGLYPIFSRTLVLSGSILTTSTASIVYDYRSGAEQAFVQNVYGTSYALTGLDAPVTAPAGEQIPYVYGSPFGLFDDSFLPPHTPPSGQQVGYPDDIDALEFDAPTGTVTIQHAYGGNLIAGMSSISSPTAVPPPYYGGLISVAGRAPNDTTSATIPITNTTADMTFVDPQWAQMGSRTWEAGPANNIYDAQCISGACLAQFNALYVAYHSTTKVGVEVDQWNPWALGGSQYVACVALDCFPVTSGATYDSRSPFYDSGNVLSYYNWQAISGAATGVTQSGSQYAIAYSGGTSGYIGSSQAAWFVPSMDVVFQTNAPDGTIFYLTLSCPDGTLQNSGATNGGEAVFTLTSVTSVEQCSTIQIGFALPPGSATSGTINIGPFGYDGTP
jgi:hypothetical protein